MEGIVRSLERVPSQPLGRPVHVWRFGHYGPPLLAFPSSAGVAHEWEHGGLVAALGSRLADGQLKLYCTESNVSESWMDVSHPGVRARRHLAFEAYVVYELVPRIRIDCQDPHAKIGVAGVSLGAFYAALFALKYPEIFDYALCLSGRYDARSLTGGYEDPAVDQSNPVALVGMAHERHVVALREGIRIDLVCGQGPWEGENVEATRQFGRVLASRQIPHRVDLWGRDAAHDWRWWTRQTLHYLGQRYRWPG